MTKRASTHGDRDVLVAKHHSIPDTIHDEPGTGVVEGDALKKHRRKKTTTARVERVEDRTDSIEKSIAEWRVESATNMGDIKEAVGKLAGTVAGLDTVVRDMAERKQVTYVAGVNIQEAQTVAATEVSKTEAVAALEAPGHRWKLVVAVVGLTTAILEGLHLVFG